MLTLSVFKQFSAVCKSADNVFPFLQCSFPRYSALLALQHHNMVESFVTPF